MLTIFEKSKQGSAQIDIPTTGVPAYNLDKTYLSEKPANLPEIAEIEVVRHYTELSTRAFGVDNGFYPLGSCTMKYNPKLNEATASLQGFARIHPLQKQSDVKGALELMYNLSAALCEICGMDGFALSPAAGAQGEFAGLNIIKKYHEKNGDSKRTKIIVPDAAHGTNPASAALCGLEVVNIPSLADGSVDLDALSAVLDDTVAGLMLTNPSTLGLFERNIKQVADLVHAAGGLLYYDGANLNAIMGIARPGDMGFDVVHLNLHKTFSTPHGGGGPGAGPVGCVAQLVPFLPAPVIEKTTNGFSFAVPAHTIGKVKAFYGNFAVLVKAYTYILALGRDGLKDASEKAVLNANYLKKKLAIIDAEPDRVCMHEFVASFDQIKKRTGVSALDAAKAMIDVKIHPPTMYFPLIVPEALMFEPTETETKETIDDAAEKILAIVARADTDPESLHNAPLSAPISRPDEVLAARQPVLTFTDNN